MSIDLSHHQQMLKRIKDLEIQNDYYKNELKVFQEYGFSEPNSNSKHKMNSSSPDVSSKTLESREN
tara:strand:+ start:481 stop:678 length:198 start_codon:yes stop_codon:yes gene_type:complete